jgi:hypothetical protein
VTAVAHFPASLDKGPLERFRRPLSALAATILVIDLMGLGMHLADSVESPFANDTPTRTKARVDGPEALVPSSANPGANPVSRAGARVSPDGCLALNSGCYAGPVAPPSSGSGGTTTNPSGGNTATPPTTAPKPLAQANVAVPALGVQASLGLGDGGCTGLDLTVLAVGECPAASGEGPLLVNLGGSLLGGE